MTTNRSIKTGMATMALVGAVAFGGAALTPILANAKSGSQTFSHAFRKATPDQVVNWMKSQGINVQVSPSDLPEGRLTFAFDGMSRDELVKSFGSMVGLRTEQRGGVYSLLRGVGSDGASEPLGSEDSASDPCPLIDLTDQRDLIELSLLNQERMHDLYEFSFEPFAQDPGKLVEEIMKALEEAGAFSGQKMNEQQKMALREKLAARLGKAHSFVMPEGFKHAMPGKDGQRFFYFDPQKTELGPEHKKRMEELHKHMLELEKQGHLKSFNHEHMQKMMEEMHKGGVYQKLTPEQLEKMKAEGKAQFFNHEHMQKMMEEMHKGGVYQKLTPEQLEKMKAEGKIKFFTAEEARKMAEEMRKSGKTEFFDGELFRKNMDQWQKEFGENMKVMQLKMENVKKFIASLTPAQKALADKQGYLRPEDLTKEQRELLGIGDKPGVNMELHIDGQKIVIKGSESKTTGGTTSGKKGVITA